MKKCDHIYHPTYNGKHPIGQTCALCGKFNSIEDVLRMGHTDGLGPFDSSDRVEKPESSIPIIATLILAAVILFGVLAYTSRRAECYDFSQTTGYWVKFSPFSGCFVLIDNQYLVNKDNLSPTDRPAYDPDIVGMETVINEEMKR